MVGDEADRADEDVVDLSVVERGEVVEDVRPEPGLAGRGLALVGERPSVELRLVGYQPRRRQQLPLVGVALVEDARREAVGGEDDVGLRAADAVGEERDEAGIVVPAVDEGQAARPSSASSRRRR